MSKVEKRCAPAEMRAVETEGDKTRIEGYAIVWNSQSVDLGGFREVIRPGTFKRSLESDQDIVSTANHDPKMILARQSNGTLKITEDQKGLFLEATPPDTTAGRDTIELVRGGYLAGMSFQFMNKRGTDKFTRQTDGTVVREVTDAELIELGPVTFPAYSQTTVSAETRSAVEALQRDELDTEGGGTVVNVVVENNARDTEVSVEERDLDGETELRLLVSNKETLEASSDEAGAPAETSTEENPQAMTLVELLSKELDLMELE